MDKLIRDTLLKDMESSVGTKDPLIYFKNLVHVLRIAFNQLDDLEEQNKILQIKSALAIKWEPRLALDMLDSEIEVLRNDRDMYHLEISALKKARMEDSVTQNYESFCKFWQDTLGYHPFLEY